MNFDTFEVLFEFNKSIHHGVLCLEALTKHDGFDRETISTLAGDVVKAKAAANAYLISVIGAAECTVAAAHSTVNPAVTRERPNEEVGAPSLTQCFPKWVLPVKVLYSRRD